MAIGTAQPAATKLKQLATGVIKKLSPKKAVICAVVTCPACSTANTEFATNLCSACGHTLYEDTTPSAPPANELWDCQACTLENESDSVACSACETPRFPTEAIAAEYDSTLYPVPSAPSAVTETTDEDLALALRRSAAKAHARKEYEEARALKAAAAEQRALKASLSWQCPLVRTHQLNPIEQSYCQDCWDKLGLTMVKPAQRRPLK